METLTVTYLKPIQGFLQIFGHKKPELLEQLNSQICAYHPSLKKIATQDELYPSIEFDTIYLAHTIGTNKYHRCIVREKRPNNKAIIELIDYGNGFEVDASLLLALDPKNKIAEFLREFPPIATSYILAGFFCNWKSNEMYIIESCLKGAKLPISNEQMDRDHRFISLTFNDVDVATKLINSNVGMDISFTEQRLEIRNMFDRRYNLFTNGSASPVRREKRRNLVPNRPLQSSINNNCKNNNNNNIPNNMITNQSKRMIQNMVLSNKQSSNQRGTVAQDTTDTVGIIQSSVSRIPAFTATELPIGQFHQVLCSYVEDGPNLFWVQLKHQEHTLNRMTMDLANAPRTPLKSNLDTGMACIARFSEDKQLYRAVIQKVDRTGCRVTFIDFGNSEFVAFNDLYEIPNNFLEYKTFAMSFQLNGLNQLGKIHQRMKEFFASLIEKASMLELRVNPSSNSQVQHCELYISNGENVFDILKRKKAEFNSFANPPILKTDDYVVIRGALTAKKLFVQRCDDIPAFDQMMDALFAHCHKTTQITILPKIGTCCAAMANGDDKEWYRAIVVNHLDAERVQVQFVDYGNEMACHLSDLRDITSTFLELPRQVNECCLVDFEDIATISESTGYQLSMLIDDPQGKTIMYKALVKKHLPNGTYVVDLLDEAKDLRVSYSIYRLAMPRNNHNKLSKSANEAEKITRAPVNNRINVQGVRENDDIEQHEKHPDNNVNVNANRQKERLSGNRSGNEDKAGLVRVKSNKPQNDNFKAISNGSVKNHGNRPENDIRRNGDTNHKRSILQKHIIPRFNKRPNRSRNNHSGKRMIGVDKSDKWDSTAGDSSSEHLSTDISSKSTKNAVNKATFVPITSEEFVGLNPIIPEAIPFPVNSSAKMNYLYWNSPFEFYLQLKSMEQNCDEMMHQIQQYYHKRAAIQQKVPIGSLVIVRHKEDRVIKRARVIDYNQQRDKYRVQFIDYGDKAICSLSDMFEIEKSFTKLPEMAICCCLEPAILNKPLTDIRDKVCSLFESSVNVDCKNVHQDQNKNTVDVHVNGENLRDLLIRDNFLTHLPKDISVERLVGQTLMAHVTAVTDLKSFQVTFYSCDIAFMCSYKDLNLVKKNSHLSDELRATVNQHIKVKVESIGKDNVLMMSIYLPHLDQYNALDDICCYPILHHQFTGLISHVETPCTVYIQNKDHMGKMDHLLDDLYNACENEASISTPIQLNHTYAVQSADSNYYRGRVEQYLDDDKVSVRMIDYGNLEIVTTTALKKLPNQLAASISVLAHKMFIPVKFNDGYTVDHIDMNMEPIVRILGTYKSAYGEYFICDLIVNGISMIDELEQSKKAIRLNINQFNEFIEQIECQKQQADDINIIEKNVIVEASQSKCSIPSNEIDSAIEISAVDEAVPIDLPENSNTMKTPDTTIVPNVEMPTQFAYLSHIDNPNRFYIQLDSNTEAIRSFQRNLQIIAPQLPALSDFRAGQMCIAKYSVDDEWYRARIIDTDREITSIQFIDYGNTDSITDNTLLKAPDTTLIEKEPFAMACSLAIEPHGSKEWPESANAKLLALCEDRIAYELISNDECVNYVKLFVNGHELVEEFIQEHIADKLEIIRTGEICYVSHVNTLSDFYIQEDSDSEALSIIEDHLNAQHNTELLENPSIGTICAALFEDGKFYRARIMDILSDASYQVEFLDYGNIEMSTDVRSLKPQIAQLPHLRKRCYLKMPNDIEHWSDDAEKRFRELSNDGATQFVVHLIKPGQAACIELFMSDKNVSEFLGELCEKKTATPIIIDDQESTLIEHTSTLSISVNDFPSGQFDCLLSHVISPNDFYIQFVNKTENLYLMTSELRKGSELEVLNPIEIEVGTIVAALFPDDGNYYRARVLEKLMQGIKVIFIDYGNTCIVTEIRKVPSIISTIIPLASHCTLANDQLEQFTADDNNVFVGFMFEEPEPTFQVEAINATSTKSTVTLYRNGIDILACIRTKQIQSNAQDDVATTILSDIIEEVATICE